MTERSVSIDDAVTQSAVKLSVQLREKKRKALLGFYQRNDVFVFLPTGYGKSLIFALLPLARGPSLLEISSMVAGTIEI